jgi:hypothetical protein
MMFVQKLNYNTRTATGTIATWLSPMLRKPKIISKRTYNSISDFQRMAISPHFYKSVKFACLCQEVGMDKVRFGSPHLLEYTQQIVMEGIQMALILNNTRRTMLEEHFADLRKLDQWHRSEYPVLSWNPQLLKEFAPDNSI